MGQGGGTHIIKTVQYMNSFLFPDSSKRTETIEAKLSGKSMMGLSYKRLVDPFCRCEKNGLISKTFQMVIGEVGEDSREIEKASSK